jgi:hypothetical protein
VRRRRLFRRAAEGGAWRLHVPPGAILAVDIETTGLDPRVDDVTCACVYDAEGGVARSFVFMRDGPGAREEFLALLDAAPRLCAFNGVRFDLPFLARRWGLAPERVGAWVRKLVDPFEASKLALNRTFSLDRLLAGWPAERRILWADEALAGARAAVQAAGRGGPWAILVGPEGGFSEKERARLRAMPQVVPVSLGPRILRADTAAVAALTLWQSVLGDWA